MGRIVFFLPALVPSFGISVATGLWVGSAVTAGAFALGVLTCSTPSGRTATLPWPDRGPPIDWEAMKKLLIESAPINREA